MIIRNRTDVNDVHRRSLWHDMTASGFHSIHAVTGSAFGTVFATINLALQRALQRGEHQTQQTNDAKKPSNIANFVFPLVMNVVTVSVIAEVSTIGILPYTLLTGVLTAVPVAIKGVELLLIGNRSNR